MVSFLWLSPLLTAVGNKCGIDAHYFAKNSSLVLLGHGIQILRGIITGYVVARFFQQEIYGQYQFMLTVVGMLTVFGLPGLASSVTRAWARGDSFSRRKLTKWHLLVCLTGSLILLGMIPFLEYYGREELWMLFLVAAVLFPLSPIATVNFGGYTVGKARFDLSLYATIAWSILSIIATLAIVAFRQSAVLMFAASTAIPSIVYLWGSRRLQPPNKNGPDNTRSILRYGWQLTLANTPVDLVWYIDKLLISHFFGLNQLALFSVALLIPEQVKLFVKQLLPVTFARQAAGKDSRERRRKLMKFVLAGTAIFAAGIALYIVLVPFLMPLLFPKYDARELTILTSVAAATLITFPGTLFAQYLEAQRMVWAVRFSNWSAAAVLAVSLFILVPWLGLLGAIIARGLFRAVYLAATWWFVLRAPIQDKPAAVPLPVTDEVPFPPVP